MSYDDEYEEKVEDGKKIDILTKDLEDRFNNEQEDEKKEDRSKIYMKNSRIPTILAGFITLATGIAVLVQAIWMTNIFGNLNRYVIISVGMLLIIIGIFTVSRSN